MNGKKDIKSYFSSLIKANRFIKNNIFKAINTITIKILETMIVFYKTNHFNTGTYEFIQRGR